MLSISRFIPPHILHDFITFFLRTHIFSRCSNVGVFIVISSTLCQIRPLFDQHGNVLEVALIKDKRTGQQQGMNMHTNFYCRIYMYVFSGPFRSEEVDSNPTCLISHLLKPTFSSFNVIPEEAKIKLDINLLREWKYWFLNFASPVVGLSRLVYISYGWTCFKDIFVSCEDNYMIFTVIGSKIASSTFWFDAIEWLMMIWLIL